MPLNIVIIGNGISGITCAKNIRKQSNHQITVISSETDHFYSRTALMYIFMGHLKYEHTKGHEDWFWKKNNINLIRAHVSSIDTKDKTLQLDNDSTLAYDKLVIATGSVSNKPIFPGSDLQGVQTLYGIPDLELMEMNTKDIQSAVIVGGGLIGIEMAEMLISRNVRVTFLVREKSYWNNVLPDEEAQIISRHIREHHVDLKTGVELQEVVAGENGRIKSVLTKSGEEIPCEFVGLTVGVSPNIALTKNSDIESDRGILVNEFFETNIEGIYSIGDCAQFKTPLPGRKAVEQVWYTGRMHGETLASTLCGKRRAYNPGPWFNSAKFFDIEYQTYGTVNPVVAEDEESFYWEHENGKICFRAVYGKVDRSIRGFNVLGMRLRHELCDRWLKEKWNIDDVMINLQKLNFNPEFSEKNDRQILDLYNQNTGKKLKATSKRSFSLF
jgi:NAD(P)H-nitrite reductase large subunit